MYDSDSNDLVWRVRFRGDNDQPQRLRVLLMIEFQSQIDWFAALRVQSCAVRISEEMWKHRRPGRKDHLPPVLVVVYRGPADWKAVNGLVDLKALPRLLEPDEPVGQICFRCSGRRSRRPGSIWRIWRIVKG